MSENSSLGDIFPGISSESLVKLEQFEDLLIQYNSKLNLISKPTISKLRSKHLSDCLLALDYLGKEILSDHPVYDFGSGNGLPGIVASLLFPDQKFILVERDLRKAEFLKIAIDELKLNKTEVFDKDLSQLPEDSCFKIMSRAMAPIPKFLLETRKRTQVGGTAYLFKGEHWSTELSAVPAQIFEHWEVDLVNSYQLPDDEGERFIIRCQRI